jgi:hypothetical protein
VREGSGNKPHQREKRCAAGRTRKEWEQTVDPGEDGRAEASFPELLKPLERGHVGAQPQMKYCNILSDSDSYWNFAIFGFQNLVQHSPCLRYYFRKYIRRNAPKSYVSWMSSLFEKLYSAKIVQIFHEREYEFHETFPQIFKIPSN